MAGSQSCLNLFLKLVTTRFGGGKAPQHVVLPTSQLASLEHPRTLPLHLIQQKKKQGLSPSNFIIFCCCPHGHDPFPGWELVQPFCRVSVEHRPIRHHQLTPGCKHVANESEKRDLRKKWHTHAVRGGSYQVQKPSRSRENQA